MKKLIFLLFVIIQLALLPIAHGSKITPGTSCKKAGATQVYKGKTYTCIKLGKKLYWNNGVKVNKYPKSLSVSIFVSSQSRIYWGPLPFSCTNSTDPSYGTILDLGWDRVSLKLYDGKGDLVGVPESSPNVKLTNGGCSINYQYSNLSLKTGPLVMRAGVRSEWNIPESDWIRGSVVLSGDSVPFGPGN